MSLFQRVEFMKCLLNPTTTNVWTLQPILLHTLSFFPNQTILVRKVKLSGVLIIIKYLTSLYLKDVLNLHTICFFKDALMGWKSQVHFNGPTCKKNILCSDFELYFGLVYF